MALNTIESAQGLKDFIESAEFTVICFSAQWCGPCKASHPQLVQLAQKFHDSYGDKLLRTGIVYEDKLGDAMHSYGVKAFPTYVIFGDFSRKEVGRVQGVNFAGVQELVDQSGLADRRAWKEQAGQSLGGGGPRVSAQEARLARLAALDKKQPAAKPAPAEEATAKPAQQPADVEMNETTTTAVEDVDMTDEAKETSTTEAEAPKDPCENIDKGALEELTESMGFPVIRAQKGLLYGGNTAAGAVEWLLAHQEEAGIDDPIPTGDVNAKSYKCNDCGKILSNMANLELHANKTGHADFAESTEEIVPLTEEQKKAKLLEIKDLLAVKRAEREEKERQENVEREKRRRLEGQEMSKTREQLEIEQRKRETYKRKKEKTDAKKERDRICAELEKDKRERMANKGKLKGKLGVDGYNPDAIQYDVGGEGGEEKGAATHTVKPKNTKKSGMKVDDCIKKVSAYRAGGDGEKCLKILFAYMKNVVDNDDPKFCTINMENKAFRAKVKPFIGGRQLLIAVGFQADEKNEFLHLSEDADVNLLKDTREKLEKAIASY
jgi:thiol-disulfide isomerase/thioredoxin